MQQKAREAIIDDALIALSRRRYISSEEMLFGISSIPRALTLKKMRPSHVSPAKSPRENVSQLMGSIDVAERAIVACSCRSRHRKMMPAWWHDNTLNTNYRGTEEFKLEK